MSSGNHEPVLILSAVAPQSAKLGISYTSGDNKNPPEIDRHSLHPSYYRRILEGQEYICPHGRGLIDYKPEQTFNSR